MSAISAFERMLTRYGATVTLARAGEAATISLLGKRIPGTPTEVGGSATHQSFRVKIGTSELAASAWASKAPARGDTITVDGVPRVIEDAQPLSVGEVVAVWLLEVAG